MEENKMGFLVNKKIKSYGDIQVKVITNTFGNAEDFEYDVNTWLAAHDHEFNYRDIKYTSAVVGTTMIMSAMVICEKK